MVLCEARKRHVPPPWTRCGHSGGGEGGSCEGGPCAEPPPVGECPRSGGCSCGPLEAGGRRGQRVVAFFPHHLQHAHARTKIGARDGTGRGGRRTTRWGHERARPPHTARQCQTQGEKLRARWIQLWKDLCAMRPHPALSARASVRPCLGGAARTPRDPTCNQPNHSTLDAPTPRGPERDRVSAAHSAST